MELTKETSTSCKSNHSLSVVGVSGLGLATITVGHGIQYININSVNAVVCSGGSILAVFLTVKYGTSISAEIEGAMIFEELFAEKSIAYSFAQPNQDLTACCNQYR
jgi:hypothetical protein